MLVKLLNGLGEVTSVVATRVLITDDADTPMVIATEWADGCVMCAHAGEPAGRFQAMLTALGVDRTVHVTRYTPGEVPTIDLG